MHELISIYSDSFNDEYFPSLVASAQMTNNTLGLIDTMVERFPFNVTDERVCRCVSSVLASRALSGVALLASAFEILSLRALVQPLKSTQIIYDRGVSVDSVSRTIASSTLSVGLTVGKVVIAACSIIYPEKTFSSLYADQVLLKLYFYQNALRFVPWCMVGGFVEEASKLHKQNEFLLSNPQYFFDKVLLETLADVEVRD